MSLATRCPACGTVFRVVRDQLKVSEGWVRCGRCSEVFNAGQRLFDLEQDASARVAVPPRPPGTTAQGAVRTAVAPAAQAAPPGLAPLSPAAARVKSAWAPPSQPAVLWAPESEPQPLMAAAAQPPVPAEAAPATEVQAVSSATAEAPEANEAHALTAKPTTQAEQDIAQAAGEPQPTPGFVLRADRAARWRHPARRSTLALLSLLLAALLAAQLALNFRDTLAAASPTVAKPWLEAACRLLGCRIEAPRRIDSLSVDSSGLVRVEGSALYRLSLVVHNRAATAVRMPAIDLALTDTQGQTMARRVLLAAELGEPADSLPARGEVALQAMLELGERRVAGYTVELFYP